MKSARVRATHKDFVLDVGSGGFPHSTADILVDRFIDDTEGHRSGKVLIRDRPLVQADITALPFRDKSFDYVIANQIIEHIKQKQPHRSFGTTTLYGGAFWMLHDDPGFKKFMLEHSNLFWVNLEWEETIHYRVVPPDHSFYDYHDRDSVASLLAVSRPEDLSESVKWWLRSHFDLRTLYQFTRLRSLLRQMMKHLWFE
jgi:hypothetical protein